MENYSITEAFKALDEVSEIELKDLEPKKSIFSFNDSDDVEELKAIMDIDEVEEEDPIEMIIDVDAEDEEELKDTYVGDLILQCNVCKSLLYKPEDQLVKDETVEDRDVYNVDEECPHCHKMLGYSLIGKVAPYDAEESEELQAEDEAGEDFEDEEVFQSTEKEPVEDVDFEEEEKVEVKESLNEDLDKAKELTDVVKDQLEVIDRKASGAQSNVEKIKDELDESCDNCKESEKEELKEEDKPAAISIDDAQKWVDYDMKRYGKISGKTNDLVKKAGFQIIKDDHGDYEVAAGKYDESLEEAKEGLDRKTIKAIHSEADYLFSEENKEYIEEDGFTLEEWLKGYLEEDPNSDDGIGSVVWESADPSLSKALEEGKEKLVYEELFKYLKTKCDKEFGPDYWNSIDVFDLNDLSQFDESCRKNKINEAKDKLSKGAIQGIHSAVNYLFSKQNRKDIAEDGFTLEDWLKGYLEEDPDSNDGIGDIVWESENYSLYKALDSGKVKLVYDELYRYLKEKCDKEFGPDYWKNIKVEYQFNESLKEDSDKANDLVTKETSEKTIKDWYNFVAGKAIKEFGLPQIYLDDISIVAEGPEADIDISLEDVWDKLTNLELSYRILDFFARNKYSEDGWVERDIKERNKIIKACGGPIMKTQVRKANKKLSEACKNEECEDCKEACKVIKEASLDYGKSIVGLDIDEHQFKEFYAKKYGIDSYDDVPFYFDDISIVADDGDADIDITLEDIHGKKWTADKLAKHIHDFLKKYKYDEDEEDWILRKTDSGLSPLIDESNKEIFNKLTKKYGGSYKLSQKKLDNNWWRFVIANFNGDSAVSVYVYPESTNPLTYTLSCRYTFYYGADDTEEETLNKENNEIDRDINNLTSFNEISKNIDKFFKEVENKSGINPIDKKSLAEACEEAMFDNVKFDKEVFGKYFDENGHLIPELEKEYWKAVEDHRREKEVIKDEACKEESCKNEALTQKVFDRLLQKGNSKESDKLGDAFIKECDRLGIDQENASNYSELYAKLDKQGKENITKVIKSFEESCKNEECEDCDEECRDEELEEASEEIDRVGFKSLIKYADPVLAKANYGILNDGNFVDKFWAKDDEEAKKIFRSEDEDNIKLEGIDEELFDKLVNNYIKEVYDNVESYTTTGGSVDHKDSKVVLEGKIKFKSGKEQDTKFIFEEAKLTKKGKLKLKGINETFAKMKKAFTLQGSLKDNALLAESFTYNYKVSSNGGVKRIYGTEKIPMNEDLKVITDFSSYEPWAGAVDTYNKISDAGMLDIFEQTMEDTYPDGIDQTELNDLLWFDGDSILEMLGLKDEEVIGEECQEECKNEELKSVEDPELAQEVAEVSKDLMDMSDDARVDGAMVTAKKLEKAADDLDSDKIEEELEKARDFDLDHRIDKVYNELDDLAYEAHKKGYEETADSLMASAEELENDQITEEVESDLSEDDKKEIHSTIDYFFDPDFKSLMSDEEWKDFIDTLLKEPAISEEGIANAFEGCSDELRTLLDSDKESLVYEEAKRYLSNKIDGLEEGCKKESCEEEMESEVKEDLDVNDQAKLDGIVYNHLADAAYEAEVEHGLDAHREDMEKAEDSFNDDFYFGESLQENINSVVINQDQEDEIKLEADDIKEVEVKEEDGKKIIEVEQEEKLEDLDTEPYLSDVEDEIEAEFSKGEAAPVEAPVEMIAPVEDEESVSDEEAEAEIEAEFNK